MSRENPLSGNPGDLLPEPMAESSEERNLEGFSTLISSTPSLANLIEFLPIGVAVYTLEEPGDLGSFRCRHRNAAATEISRVPDELLLGKTIRESVPALLDTDIPASWELALRTGQVQKLPAFRYGDNKVAESVFDITVVPLNSDAVAVCYDLVSAEQIEVDAIKTEQARLEYLMSSVHSIIYTTKATADYGLTFVSDNVADVLGYQPSDFIGHNELWTEIVHPDDAPRVFEAISNIDDSHSIEYRMRHRDGHYRWIQDQLKVIRDDLQIPVELVGTWSDITERVEAERALRTAASWCPVTRPLSRPTTARRRWMRTRR